MSFIIRKGEAKDVKAILELIIELAVFEKLPNEVEVTEEELLNDGFSNSPKFKTFVAKEIAGVVIDLLVDFEGKLYALDLVGFPGVYQATFPIEKYKTLYRMDVEILVVPYSFWSRDNKKCKEFIQSKIG